MSHNEKSEINKVEQQIASLRTSLVKQKINIKEGALKETVGGTQYNVGTFKETKILAGHFGKIYAMHWAEDSCHLASASQDGKLMIWDAQQNHKKHMINLRSSWVMTCAYAPSGEFVACGGLDNLCSIYKVDFMQAETHERPKFELSRHDGYLSCCRFKDNQNIFTSSGDGSIIHWNINRSQPQTIYTSHDSDVMSISLKPNQPDVFVSGSCDQNAMVWDTRTSQSLPVQKFVGHESDINCVQWYPDDFCFASGSDDSSVRLFDTRSYSQVNYYRSNKIKCGVTYIDFSKTGKYLFCGYDDAPYGAVWNSLNSTFLQDLQNQRTRISCLGVPNSGKCLCTGSWDNTLQIWTQS